MTLVTHVTGVSTFKDCDRKHSLLNRVEKLGFGASRIMFFLKLNTCGKTRHTRHTRHTVARYGQNIRAVYPAAKIAQNHVFF